MSTAVRHRCEASEVVKGVAKVTPFFLPNEELSSSSTSEQERGFDTGLSALSCWSPHCLRHSPKETLAAYPKSEAKWPPARVSSIFMTD